MTQTGRQVDDPRRFGKVAVLMGGRSAERGVSLKSGGAVLRALQAQGVDAHGIDAGHDVLKVLEAGRYDRVFIMLHGRGGEDGVIQGALETLGLPYTGSGVLGSALSMDKLRTKRLWQSHGLPTPPFAALSGDIDLAAQVRDVGLPMILKPVHEGSSFGMTKVRDLSQLRAAWEAAREFDAVVLAEHWITGAEFTAGIVGRQILPLIRIETPREFYDFKAKYEADDTRYHCPCGLDAATEEALQTMALQAFDVLGCSGWGRVDFMCDGEGRPWLLEVNTVPGMTDHSLVPKAARQAGMDFNVLAWRILETSLAGDRPRPADAAGGASPMPLSRVPG
jgi:D-alanine-D-alanine ligase